MRLCELVASDKGGLTADQAKEIIQKTTIVRVEVHIGLDGDFWVAERKKAKGIGWTVLAKRKSKEKLLKAVHAWFEEIPVDPWGMYILSIFEY